MGGGAEHNFVSHYLGAGHLFSSFLFFIFEKGLSLIDLNFDKKDRLVGKQVLTPPPPVSISSVVGLYYHSQLLLHRFLGWNLSLHASNASTLSIELFYFIENNNEKKTIVVQTAFLSLLETGSPMAQVDIQLIM